MASTIFRANSMWFLTMVYYKSWCLCSQSSWYKSGEVIQWSYQIMLSKLSFCSWSLPNVHPQKRQTVWTFTKKYCFIFFKNIDKHFDYSVPVILSFHVNEEPCHIFVNKEKKYEYLLNLLYFYSWQNWPFFIIYYFFFYLWSQQWYLIKDLYAYLYEYKAWTCLYHWKKSVSFCSSRYQDIQFFLYTLQAVIFLFLN